MDGTATSEDVLLGGRVRLIQPLRGHRAGTDAVLLAGLVEVGEGDRVVDLGSASGAVGLMVAVRHPGAVVTFVDRDSVLIDLCRRNIRLNGLEGRAVAIEADAFGSAASRAEAGLRPGSADLVVTNPPFFDDQSRPSPDPARRAAHAMQGGSLDDWVRCASDCLSGRGRLCMIQRADRLDACLAALRGFGSVAIRPIYPREGTVASRIVISAVKGGRGPLTLRSPIVFHNADGSFTPAAERLNR